MSYGTTPPAAPDYTSLVDRTSAASKAATDAATAANRPNQTDPYGNTSSWTQDPTTGQWTQKTSLGGANQAMYDQEQALKSGLLGQAAGTLGQPIDTSGMTAYGSYDPSKLQGVNTDLGGGNFNMDPIGNSTAVQNATYSRLGQQRDIQRNNEIQRLKNQGLTEGSPAWNAALTRLDQGDTDAQMQSLLAGYQEYGNQFGRAKDQNAQNFGQGLDQQKLALALRGQQGNEQDVMAKFADAQRKQQFGEAQDIRNMPLNDMKGLMDASAFQKPEFSQFASAGTAGSPDYLNAGSKQYQDMLANWNASQLSKDRNISTGMDVFGDVMKSPIGTDMYNKFSTWLGSQF